MAAFQALADYSQATAGKIITFYDISPYGDNTEDIEITDFSEREFLIYDAYNTLLDTLVLEGTDLSVTYTVLKDSELTAVLNLTGIYPVEDYTKTINCPLQRNTDNLFNTLLVKDTGNCNTIPSLQATLNKSMCYMYGATKAALYGQKSTYDLFINAAQSYLGQY